MSGAHTHLTAASLHAPTPHNKCEVQFLLRGRAVRFTYLPYPIIQRCRIDGEIGVAKAQGKKSAVVLTGDIWPENKLEAMGVSLGGAIFAALANTSNSSSPMHTAVKECADGLEDDGFTVVYDDVGPSLKISWK